jgi:hypothetical protein
VGEIRRLQVEFPQVSIQVIQSTGAAPNGKVAVLADLEKHARYPLRVVNDSDILSSAITCGACSRPWAIRPRAGDVSLSRDRRCVARAMGVARDCDGFRTQRDGGSSVRRE